MYNVILYPFIVILIVCLSILPLDWDKYIVIVFVNGVNKGEINIPEDKMLEKVEYDADSNSLIFTWNTSTEQEPTDLPDG